MQSRHLDSTCARRRPSTELRTSSAAAGQLSGASQHTATNLLVTSRPVQVATFPTLKAWGCVPVESGYLDCSGKISAKSVKSVPKETQNVSSFIKNNPG